MHGGRCRTATRRRAVVAVVVAPAQAVRVHRLVDARAEHRLREIKSDNDGWLVVSG